MIAIGNTVGGPIGFHFVYSSPGRYFTAKAAAPPKPFPLRTDDIFPYADRPDAVCGQDIILLMCGFMTLSRLAPQLVWLLYVPPCA